MRYVLILIYFVVITATATASEPSVTISAVDGWSAFFGEQTSSLGYHIRGEVPPSSRLVWSHTADRRTLARGERAIGPGNGEAKVMRIELQIPPVREGIVFDTQLRVKVVEPGGNVAAEGERTLRIFARDPFANRRQWLEQLQTVLYDPDGETAQVFDDSKIPYTSARNLSVLQGTKKGPVIIGEGVSLSAQSNLAGVVNDLVSQGRKVICLAPTDGDLTFPGHDDAVVAPTRITLRRSDVITELDKRLDAVQWPPDGQVIRSALLVTSRRGRVVLSVDEAPTAWPWIDVWYSGGGRLTVCGFAIVRQWQAGPTPRYLFAKMLERENRD